MADSLAFECVVGELERATSLGRAAARTVLRSVLERALFDPADVSASQLRLLVEKLLAAQLHKRGVKDAERVCRQLQAALTAQAPLVEGPESPDEIFGRMIRR